MTIAEKIIGFGKATHFGPTILVCTTAFFLASTQFSTKGSLEVTLAIFFGQCTVGWSNDLIDLENDRSANRYNKPLVIGSIQAKTLNYLIFVSLILAIVFSIVGPLKLVGTIIHLLGIASAMAYNFGLKRTMISFLPYVISFGAMPWAVYRANYKSPPLWLYAGFAIFTVAFHFLNVIKDMEKDREQLIMGLPQRLGSKLSAVVAGVLIFCGCALIILK